jgi:hypothetical protein
MKNIPNLLKILGTAALMALAVGCASTKQTEDLLSAAGFKITPATTPQQQAHLKTLPPHKVTMVKRATKTYFVYPDTARQVLYVGQEAQYQQYQKLLAQTQAAEDQVRAAEMDWETGWDAWGGVLDEPILRR